MAEKISVPKNVTTTRAQTIEPLKPPSVVVNVPEPRVVVTKEYWYNRWALAFWFLMGWQVGWISALLVVWWHG